MAKALGWCGRSGDHCLGLSGLFSRLQWSSGKCDMCADYRYKIKAETMRKSRGNHRKSMVDLKISGLLALKIDQYSAQIHGKRRVVISFQGVGIPPRSLGRA